MQGERMVKFDGRMGASELKKERLQFATLPPFWHACVGVWCVQCMCVCVCGAPVHEGRVVHVPFMVQVASCGPVRKYP